MQRFQIISIVLLLFAGCRPAAPTVADGHAALYDWKLLEAENIYNEILRTDSTNVGALTGRGAVLRQFGLYDPALLDLNLAIKLNPNAPVAYFNRGKLFYDLEKASEAVADFEQALTLHYSNSDLHNDLGILYSKSGDRDKAIEQYSAAIELDPQEPQYFINRGANRVEAGKLTEAIDDFSAAIALAPEDYTPFVLRFNVYRDLGDINKARADGEKAQQLNPAWKMPNSFDSL